ncbi:hypothetical protein DAMDJJ_28050 [Cupriavidus necator]|uniref:hypothetical protein n=1 Tax=Cupriavidus necator TaxID=106590 RepID=UPI003F731D2F
MDISSSISSWALNPLVKDWFLSPLAGAVMGALFNAFVNSKNNDVQSSKIQPPARTIYETRVVYRRSKDSSGGKGDNPELGFAVIFLVVVVYLYAAHAARIVDTGLTVAYCSTTFSLFFFAFAVWRGRVLGYEWAGVFLFSTVLAGTVAALLGTARAQLVPWFPAAIAKAGVVGFYLNQLDDYGRLYAVTQGLGILCTLAALLFSIGWALHYIALVNNFAVNGNSFWSAIVRMTRAFSGAFGVCFSLVLVVIAHLLLDGTILDLWWPR